MFSASRSPNSPTQTAGGEPEIHHGDGFAGEQIAALYRIPVQILALKGRELRQAAVIRLAARAATIGLVARTAIVGGVASAAAIGFIACVAAVGFIVLAAAVGHRVHIY